MKLRLLFLTLLTACAADTGGGMDNTGVAPVANEEAAALVDQDSPGFKAWLDAQYGDRALGDERVGAAIEKVVQNGFCHNNNVGDVSTSTALGKGAAMCVASQSTSGFYACSGSFSSGTCTLAFGTGVATYSVSSCGAWSGNVPFPGTVLTVAAVNRCFVNYSTLTGYVYSGLRGGGAGIPSYTYAVPAILWNARADFLVPTQAEYRWGY